MEKNNNITLNTKIINSLEDSIIKNNNKKSLYKNDQNKPNYGNSLINIELIESHIAKDKIT